MEVLLVNPPRVVPQQSDFPPMGLAYIASYLKQNGIKVGVLDASSFSWDRTAEQTVNELMIATGIKD